MISTNAGTARFFTLSDDLLSEARDLQKQYELGIHIHVAEDDCDNKLSVEFTGKRPIRRLTQYKLINIKSILVHGVHLTGKDFIKISETEGALAFCPDSNLNNSVGLPQFGDIPNNIPFLARNRWHAFEHCPLNETTISSFKRTRKQFR